MVIKYTAEELTAIGELVTLKECISREQGQTINRHEGDDVVVVTSSGDSCLKPPLGESHETAQFNQQQDNPILPKLFYLHSQFQNLFVNNHSDRQQHHHQQHQQPHYQNKQQSQEPLTQSVADFFRKAQQNFHLSQTKIDPFKVRTLSEVEADLIGSQGPY